VSTIIIAEAGVNHDGDLDVARQLVRVAAEAGADYVKFQSFNADRLVAAAAPKAEYQLAATGSAESQRDMLRRLELSRSDHEALIAECAQHNIGFLSTGFDAEHVDMLVDLGVDRLKVPSGEIVNLPLLRHIASKGLPVILSTGMATMEEVAEAVAALESAGLDRKDLTILHCNTEYPTPMGDVNLTAMRAIADEFGTKVGYSDHTPGIEVPIAAVALGASLIEKHFTLDRGRPGPDHSASLEPAELKAMVSAIRNVEQALSGDGVKRPSASEAKNRAIARPVLVAAREISAGEAFGTGNLTAKRAGAGLSPMRWDDVMGRHAPRDFAPDEPIEL